jgi:hypothetical protein
VKRAWPLFEAALALSLYLLLAGCAAPNGGADRQRHDGFYGAVEGGLVR